MVASLPFYKKLRSHAAFGWGIWTQARIWKNLSSKVQIDWQIKKSILIKTSQCLLVSFDVFLSWISFSLSLSSFFLYHFSQFFYKEGALHFTSYAITHDIFLLVHDCSVGVTWSNTPQLKLRSVHWFTPWNIPQFSNLTFNLMKVFIYIEFKVREHFDIFREGEKYFSVHTFIPKNT